MAKVDISKLDKQGLITLSEIHGSTEPLSMEMSKPAMLKALEDFGVTNEYIQEIEDKAARAGGTITTEVIGEVPEDNSIDAVTARNRAEDVREAALDSVPEDDDEEYVTIRVPKSQATAAKAAALPRGKVLMKMVRENFYYEVAGYAFSKEHPFVLVDSKTADYLTEKEEGFRPASPKEAADFYS